MNKKPLYRLYFLRELDEFKSIKKDLTRNLDTFYNPAKGNESSESNEEISNKSTELYEGIGKSPNRIDELPEQIRTRIESLTIPKNIDFIIYTNIHFTLSDNIKVDDADDCCDVLPYVDWDINIKKVRNTITEYYKEEELNQLNKKLDILKDSDAMRMLKEVQFVSSLRAGFLSIILEYCFKVIKIYFPIKEYGIPTYDLIVSMINSLYDNAEIKIDEPRINYTYDVYNIKLIKENEYLKKKLEELGLDINKEMIKDGVAFSLEAYEEGFKKNSVYSFVFNPFIDKAYLIKNANSIVNYTEKLDEELIKDIGYYSMKLDTYERQAKWYIDKRYNEKKSPKKIYFELINDDKSFTISDDKELRDQIYNLAELAGFSDLEKAVPKYSSYYKREEYLDQNFR
ncbi:MAG: hypothetical protein PHC44_04705 [Lutispora sp.]|nr:hypothetical protein [Lutispora sp.]